MASPSGPPPSPTCSVLSSQQMFQWLDKNIFAGCAGDTQNPICQAVNAAGSAPNPTLKTLADQLHHIKEKDVVHYLEGPGAQRAQMIYAILLSYLKCFLAPSSTGDKKSVKAEVDAIARIKNWYLENYLSYFGKANIPGVTFTRADARNIRQNLDRMNCKNEDVYMMTVFWVIIGGVLMLIIGWMLGHHKGKKDCLQHIAHVAAKVSS